MKTNNDNNDSAIFLEHVAKETSEPFKESAGSSVVQKVGLWVQNLFLGNPPDRKEDRPNLYDLDELETLALMVIYNRRSDLSQEYSTMLRNVLLSPETRPFFLDLVSKYVRVEAMDRYEAYEQIVLDWKFEMDSVIEENRAQGIEDAILQSRSDEPVVGF